MATDLLPSRAGFRQLLEFGYPQGRLRAVPSRDTAFSVVHITGNPGNPIASAEGELAWRINDPANQNSATFFVNRNGGIFQALGDPLHMAPWANGDVQQPDTRNPRIAALVADRVNGNERTLVAIENVGRPTDLPITDAQVEANARILAYYHAKAGVPVTRETVIGHYQLNAVSRPNCPAIDKRVIDRIVALAAPAPEEDDMPILTRPVREQWDIPAGTTLYIGGPGIGEQRTFVAANRLWSNGETLDGKWRRMEGAGLSVGQEFWVSRAAMAPVTGTRNPASGFGPPELGDSQVVRELTEALARKGTAIDQAIATLTAAGDPT